MNVQRLALIVSQAALGGLALCAVSAGYFGRTLAGGSPVAEWLEGARTATLTVALVVPIALVVGLTVGALSALGPPVFDSLLSRAMEVASGMPSVVVAVVLSRIVETRWLAIASTLALLRGLETAKVIRARLTTLDATEFVVAVRALGAGEVRLFHKHLLPHVIGSALASATLTAAAVMALEAALSFLGLGSFGPSWGAILGRSVSAGTPALATGAVLGTAITLLSLYVVGRRLDARESVGRSFI